MRRRFDLEVIVVDDASDRPVQGLPEGMRLVRHETRQGVARSRNAAARLATGDLLVHTNAHVFFSVDAIEQFIQECDGQSQIGVRTQLIYDFAQFERRQTELLNGRHYFGWRWSFEPDLAVVPIREPQSERPHDVPFVGGACLAIQRKLFETLGEFDEKLIGCGNFEDAELALTAWARGFRVRILPTVTCYHYTAPQPAWDRYGRSPLDIPRYDGSLCNVLRILRRHLPEDQFQELRIRLAGRHPVSWSSLPAAFLAELSIGETTRPEWEAQRSALAGMGCTENARQAKMTCRSLMENRSREIRYSLREFP